MNTLTAYQELCKLFHLEDGKEVCGATYWDLNGSGTRRVWWTFGHRPFWVIACRPNAGPDLTDDEIKSLICGELK